MLVTEFIEKKPQVEETVALALRIGKTALEVLRVPLEAMNQPDPPSVALIEVGTDAFTLGGRELERLARIRGVSLLSPDEVDVAVDVSKRPPDTVKLLLGQSSFDTFRTTPEVMNSYCPPAFGLANFGDAYRLAGDVIADFVEAHGGHTIRGNELDPQGHNNAGENTFN